MTKDELIKYAERKNEYLKALGSDNSDDINYEVYMLNRIALAALKSDKMGLKMCKPIAEIKNQSYYHGYEPVETELDEILKELE
jgi:hypothetical protein